MINHSHAFTAIVLAAALLGASIASAQDAFVQGQASSDTIKVTSCVVASVRDKAIQQDCTTAAAKACDGTASCELPIGLNLTGGKDIDPVGVPMARRLGKVVTVQFQCGKTVERRGPNPQNNNATLVLAC